MNISPGARRSLYRGSILAAAMVLSVGVAALLMRNTRLALGLYTGAVGATVLFVEPFIGLLNYIVLLYIRPQDFIVGLRGIPVMLMLGSATLAMALLRSAVRERRFAVPSVPQNAVMLWFLAAIAVSHLAHAYLSGAADSVHRFLPALVLYFLIVTLAASASRVHTMIKVIAMMTVALAAQGIVQHHTGFGLGGQEMYEGRIQAIGIFSDPNDLGLALVVVMPYLYLRATGYGGPFGRFVSALGLAILMYALYLTESRGGLLAFGGLLVLLLARRLGGVGGAVVGSVLFLAILALGPRMGSISTGEASAHGRIEAWGVGLDLFEQYPLFGVGANSFTEFHFRTAHNSFVLCAAELGFFGLYAWCMLIVLTVRQSAFVAREALARQADRLVLCADSVRYGSIAFVMASYFLSRTYNEIFYIFVALGAALAIHLRETSAEEFQLMDRRDWIGALGVSLGAYVVTKLFLYVAW